MRMSQIRGGFYGVEDGGESLMREYEKRKRIRFWIIAGMLLAAMIIAAAVFWFSRYHRYTSYSLKWEKELPEGSFVGYEHFGDNVLKYSHDGATYLDRSGTERWIDSYEMNNPRAYVSGDYACIYDIQGYQIRIYDVTGQVGTATTLMPVTKAVVSEAGNCASILEDDDASYINFYKKDGTEQDISIKTRLTGDGYPMDLALSPEGTRLITAFAYMDGTALRSKVVFYDFSEIGKNIPNRLVGGFEEPFKDSLVARVRFLNSTYSYAVADTGIYFFSSRNLSSPELIKEPETGERIENIVNCGSEVAVIYSDLETDAQAAERARARKDGTAVGGDRTGSGGADGGSTDGGRVKPDEAAGAQGEDEDSQRALKDQAAKGSGEKQGESRGDSPGEKEAYRLVIYRGDGSEVLNKKFTCDYDHVNTDGTYFYFKGTDSLNIFNKYGIVKYSGSMEDPAYMITKAQGAGCFVFSGTNYIREYQFK